MNENTRIAEKEFTMEFYVSVNDANACQMLSMAKAVTAIIDISILHANRLGIGNPDMSSATFGWVLSRLSLEMAQWPAITESFTITTWITSWNRRFSERCYEFHDAEGRTIGFARSIWMIIDTSTRASIGLDTLSLDPSLISARACPIPRQAKHRPFEGEAEFKRRFGYADIDAYRHVNTVRYVEMILNCVPLEEMDRSLPRRFELSFLNEGKYGELAYIRMRHEGDMREFGISAESRPLVYARLQL